MSLPIVYNPYYVTPLPAGHRFPMMKFQALYELLVREDLARSKQLHHPNIASFRLLQSVHLNEYVEAFCGGALDRQSIRRIGLPWSPGLVKRTRTAVGGTLLTAELALKHGLACNTAGGTHHAFREYGSGFCIFNDLAVAARVLIDSGRVNKILIVDLDVHQGDGTAAIFQDEPRIFTFSMHCEGNFPFTKQTSDLDISIPVGTEDDDYLRMLETYLPDLLSEIKPDLVLYDAGVDPYVDDPLGKLALTYDGLFERERTVLQACVSRGIPVACVIGGGYAHDLDELAFRHSLLHRAAAEVFEEFRL
ncbi:histone deacetylase [candidate division KSB1 bacterium]|nr:histone deacetylase [candidate division KSB1 bacterium]NIR72067.1 histone deacetylase [candidate division KSB1 bacterium]NIS26578.1 histone deacetylase [candidate division KSB1 bacterium]NIT73340.1 histone deacetylase [candidate division KSB1 bacterium]NIU27188.1 histone deacetylase [candidate division KSB1 bacterium]